MEWIKAGDKTYPGEQPRDYSGGRIERVDLVSGAVTTLYTQCEGQPLRGPNDIVFDQTGGFWFTDHGKTRLEIEIEPACFMRSRMVQ